MRLQIISILIIICSTTFADPIRVPQDYSEIQAAIDSSSSGDTILVSPGIYLENINFNGKSIVLGSLFLTTGDTSYISQTIIDGNQQGCVVVLENGEDSTTVLSGFTITNGYTYYNNSFGGGITISNKSQPQLSYLKIINNEAYDGYGGGILCRDRSKILLQHSDVSNNSSDYGGGIAILNSSATIQYLQIMNDSTRFGGGIFIEESTVEIDSSKIKQNVARNNGSGGGIWAEDSNILINKTDISNNSAIYEYSSLASYMSEGGGLYLRDCSVIIENCNISYNICEGDGGGFSIYNGSVEIYRTSISNNGVAIPRFSGGGMYIVVLSEASILLEDVVIFDNYSYGSGGGIAYGANEIIEPFKNVVIKNNSAEERGGGIIADGNLMITESSGCSIFSNKAKEEGSDIYTYLLDSNSTYEIYLDTVTVSDPDDYHIYPIQQINLQYNHAIFQSINSDIYVSPTGSNLNSGTSKEDPLKSLSLALLVASTKNNTNRTINLASGIYSPSTSGEEFPIVGRSYVSIKGERVDSTILDGENENNLIELNNHKNVTLNNFTVQNGNSYLGGGILVNGQKILLQNLILKDNYAEKHGGGLYIYNSDKVDLINLTIAHNSSNLSNSGGGISVFDGYLKGGKSISILNCITHSNTPINIELETIGQYTAMIGNSNIEGGYEGINIGGDDTVVVNWLDGNIDEDPQFVGSDPFDYNLTDTSPCINAGTPFLVWEGDTLINLSPDEYVGEAPDMGALESDVLISVEDIETLPSKYELHQNYPNPFNPSTTISYSIPEKSQVELKVFDVLGREVSKLVNKVQPAGNYEVQFKASNLGSGVYFYQIRAGNFVESKKMVILK